MWYVDGHHTTLKERACGVPVELSHLGGYNCPEIHGHKRKTSLSLTKEKVNSHSISLLHLTEQGYMKSKQWSSHRKIILTFAMSLRKYANIFETMNFNMQEIHASKRAFLNDDNTTLKILEAKITTKPIVARYSRLVQALNSVSCNDVISQ